MSMFVQSTKTEYKMPMLYFCIGFCLVLMAGWFPVFNRLDVFMQFWRVEVAASVFLAVTLAMLFYKHSDKIFSLCLSPQEINFIVLPLLVFIGWSGLSMLWAASGKSALYHTLIWAEYLIFYLVIRRFFESPKSYRLLILCLTVMLLIVAAPAVIEYCSFVYLGGATTLGIRFAKYGELVLALFPLIAAGVLRLNGRRFIGGLAAVTLLWLFMIGTLGRTNLILFVGATIGVAGLVFLFKQFHRYRRKMLWLVAALMLAPLPIHSISLLTDTPNVPIINRIGDDTGISYSNNFRKLMISVSLEAIAAHPLIGIGAGNYGLQFNRYREIYADKNPSDGNLTVAENELAERSHNEFLQIFAELGVFGSIIFLWFLSAIGVMGIHALRKFRRTPLPPLAALLGLVLFLASSAVSSYSFRFMQNGLIFFFVLAVAAKFLLAAKFDKKAIKHQPTLSPFQTKFAGAVAVAACLLLLAHCSIRVASAVYAARGNQTEDIERAASLFKIASALDDENPNADYFYGLRLLKNNQPAEAVPHFKQAIAGGLATSGTYSYLATAQIFTGNVAAAENDFAEAVRLYPHSAFARARYGFLLHNNGKIEAAQEQLNFARRINRKSANTWWNLMNQGLPETTRAAFNNSDYVPVMDLTPPESLTAVLTERNLKFPNEKVAFSFTD